MAHGELLRMAWAHTWQLTVLLVIVMLLTKCCCRNRPHLAHALWMVILIKSVTPPLWSSPSGVFCWLQRSDISEPASQNDTTIFPTPIPETAANVAMSILPQPIAPRSPGGISPSTHNLQPSISRWQIATGLWVVGVLAILVVAAVRWRNCWRSIRQAGQESRDDLTELLGKLRIRLGIRSQVQLYITSSRVGPAVIGLWKPTILLPATVVRHKTADQLEPILAHELVHVRRGDLWVGLGQVLAQSLWWFHPLVWLANRFLSHDAERCCDEEVIAELDCDPARYARSLLDVLELKQTLQPVPAFPGVRPVEVTSRRLERIMKLGQGCHKRTPWWCWLIMVCLAAIVLPGAAYVAAKDKAKSRTKSAGEPGGVSPRAEARIASTGEPGGVSSRAEARIESTGEPGSVSSRAEARIYRVKDLLDRLQDLGMPEADAKKTIEQALGEAVGPTGKSTAQLNWAGRKLIAIHSPAGHERIADAIQFVRDNGLQVQIEMQIFLGPPEMIANLHESWKSSTNIVVQENQGSSQSQVVQTAAWRPVGQLFAEVDDAGSKTLLQALDHDAQFSCVTRPKLITHVGQNACIRIGQEQPFVVGFTENKDQQPEPQLRIVPTGWDLRFLPHALSQDRVRLDCQLQWSTIESVKPVGILRGTNNERVTVEMPNVRTAKIAMTYDIALGKTLLLRGLAQTTENGKDVEALVMVRCSSLAEVARLSPTANAEPNPSAERRPRPDSAELPLPRSSPPLPVPARATETPQESSNPHRILPPKEWKAVPRREIRGQPNPTKTSSNNSRRDFSTRTYYVADLVVPLPEPLPLRQLLAEHESETGRSPKAVAADFETLIDFDHQTG